jgi:ornithine cyclodeaminase
MGLLVKTATVFPGNAARGAASINGGVSLFSDRDGTLEAILDFHLVTKWKTAGDSLLAAQKLAPRDTRTILIVGAGTVARSLREAYGAAFPDASSSSGTGRRTTRCGWPRGFRTRR